MCRRHHWYPNFVALPLVLALAMLPAIASDTPALDRDEIIDLVSEKTTECRKEKDQSLCSNWFSGDGEIKRIMHADGARKDGRWFIDDRDRLCILWNGKIKALCFAVLAQSDGSYHLIKNERHITTITGFEDGNTQNL